MVSFSDLKNTYKMQKQAKQIRRDLKNIHVEAEASGVKVVVSADMEIVSIVIAQGVAVERIPELLKDALNRALKKAQVVSSERMQGVMGQLGISPQ